MDRICFVSFCIVATALGCGADVGALPALDPPGMTPGPAVVTDQPSQGGSALPGVVCGTSSVTDRFFLPPPVKTDFLLIISSSPSMESAQLGLRHNLAAMAQQLPLHHYKLRVGVTSADLDRGGGTFFPVRGPDQRRYLDAEDPDFSTNFIENAQVGTDGSTEVAPLAALRRAIEGFEPGGANHGFRRQDALLRIAIVTADDDMSPGTIEAYRDLLSAQSTDVWLTVISGEDEGCEGYGGIAVPAPRLTMLANEVQGGFASLCVPDWSRTFDTLNQAAVREYDFRLSRTALLDSVTVSFRGQPIVEHGYPGRWPFAWRHRPRDNTIALFPTDILPEGILFSVHYRKEACR